MAFHAFKSTVLLGLIHYTFGVPLACPNASATTIYVTSTDVLITSTTVSTSSSNSAVQSSIASGTLKLATKTVATAAASTPSGFVPGVQWQIEIQDLVDAKTAVVSPTDPKVWDLDLFLTTADTISTFHTAGDIVICYFNAGAVQSTDCDWEEWVNANKTGGFAVNGYSQERYVDITDPTVVALHKKRIDLAVSKGCDGVDPDNIDTYELTTADTNLDKDITQQDVITFMNELATYAHASVTKQGLPLMVGQKNADEIAMSLSNFLDFAVTEDCLNVAAPSDGPVCSTYEKYYIQHNKPVFDIEYAPSLINVLASGHCSSGVSSSDMTAYCSGINSANISRILKLDDNDYGLNGCSQYCGQAASLTVPLITNPPKACSTNLMRLY